MPTDVLAPAAQLVTPCLPAQTVRRVARGSKAASGLPINSAMQAAPDEGRTCAAVPPGGGCASARLSLMAVA